MTPAADSWFISYNSQDKDIARAVATLLLTVEMKPWLDEWVIEPGDRVVHAINRGLQGAKGLLLLWSKNAASSAWVEREIGAALQRSIAEGTVDGREHFRVVPVVLDDTPVLPLLRDIRWVDWRDEKNRITDLLRALGHSNAQRRAVLKGLARLQEELGVEPKGFYGVLACPECGSEEFEDSQSVDEDRGDLYVGTTCKECGWWTGGEVPW